MVPLIQSSSLTNKPILGENLGMYNSTGYIESVAGYVFVCVCVFFSLFFSDSLISESLASALMLKLKQDKAYSFGSLANLSQSLSSRRTSPNLWLLGHAPSSREWWGGLPIFIHTHMPYGHGSGFMAPT